MKHRPFGLVVCLLGLVVSGSLARAQNLALNRPATGSTACNANEAPAKAVNGTVNGGTADKFCTNVTPGFLQVDLGSSLTFGRVTVRHAGAGGESTGLNTRDFNIQLSPNASTWTTVANVTGNTANVTTHAISPQSARYVRLNVTAAEQGAGTTARIYELEVYAATAGQSPYDGTAGTIANGAVIQAESYDVGGEGVAYHDTTAGNTGGQYRTDGVDIEITGDTGGGHNVGWLVDGEWLEYTVNATPGTYTITARVASGGAVVGDLRVVLDGTVLGTMAVNATGGFQTYTDVSLTGVSISGGTNRVLRIEVVNGGDFNVNSVRFTSTGATPTATPTPTATAAARPTATATTRPTATSTPPAAGCAIGATCEAEAALLGGGVTTSTLHAGYTGTGFADYAGNGTGFVEWTVSVPAAGTYTLNVRYANGGTGDRPMSILVNGATVVSSLSFPVTGWTSWTVRTQSVSLPAGSVRIRATELPNGPNVDNLVVTAASATPTATARPSPTATATATTAGQSPWGGVNGTIANGSVIQSEHYDVGGAGVAYNDSTAGNTGGQLRTDNVDIEATGDAGGGHNVGWITDGEWLEYTVNSTAGTYTVTARVASAGAAVGHIRVLLDGAVLGTIAVNATGGGQTYADASIGGIAIAGGTNRVLRVEVVNGGDFNINHIRFTSGATPTATPTTPSGGTHAFGTANGALNVDYAGYLSKHDIVYNSPNTNPLHGLQVGNGRVGAMVWSENGLTLQVSGVDTSQHTAFGAGLVNFRTSPGMDTGYSTFQQRLVLYDGVMTTRYDGNRTVTILGQPNSEVLGIHVDDTRGGVTGSTVDLKLWDLSGLPSSATGMQLDVPDMTTWKTVSTFADSTAAGLSRGQTDANNFGYTMAASVEGASFTTQTVDARTVRLNIAPSSSYTIWIVSASRINAPNFDSVARARAALSSVKATGYATTLANFKTWWHDFWAKSFVQYSNASRDADYMENVYYFSTYLIASGGYGNYPFHFINGVHRATQDNTKWSGAYWYWNQRDVYNSFLASNHIDLIDNFNRLYSRNYDRMKAYTMQRFGIDGLWVPETMGWDGNARHTDESDYTRNTLSTAYEAAFNMYLRYRYTNDAGYLSSTAYPFMRETAKFYSRALTLSGGQYRMTRSNAHETYWNVPNAITDLGAVRSVFPLAIQTSQDLGVDAGPRGEWQNVLANLAPYPTDATTYLPHQPPLAPTRNNENVACELIWPYNLTGIGAPDHARAVATWNARPFPYGNVWSPDAIQAARLGLGDGAYNGMKQMLQIYQNYPNGFTNNTNGVYEYLGVHLSVLNESLLQSHNDTIRVFPAIPGDSSFVGKFTLLAKDGFLVSAEREAGETKYVGIRSLYGKPVRIASPWPGQSVQVRRLSDNAVVLTTSAGELSFGTSAGATYVAERASRPLGSYSAVQLTGTANQGPKALQGTASRLGR